MAKNDDNSYVNEISRISKGTEFHGDIISKSDIRVDGTVFGNIITDGKLVVGDSAEIREGIIICKNADIWGKIEATTYVEEILALKATAKYTGELHLSKLSIEIGVEFSGSCSILSKDEFKKIKEGQNKPVKKEAKEDAKLNLV